jgi:hypothetical protein
MKTAKTKRAGAVMNFTLDQTAAICGINSQDLRDWVAHGIVTPIVPGGKGRGRCHRFSVQQVLGLIYTTALWKSPRGCRLPAFKEVLELAVRMHNSMSRSAIEQLMGTRADAWSEEEFNRFVSPLKASEMEAFRREHEEEDRMATDGLVRLQAVVRERAGILESRSKK